jgi:hypothetical protein
MIRLLTDENFDQNIVRGLRRRVPQLDLVSVREAGLAGHSEAEMRNHTRYVPL